jgi:hypothetical protein
MAEEKQNIKIKEIVPEQPEQKQEQKILGGSIIGGFKEIIKRYNQGIDIAGKKMVETFFPSVKEWGDVQQAQSQQQTTQTKSQSQWYPADISSFLHTAEVLKNRQILRLSQMGYKVKPTDEQYIYKKVLKSMANKGLVPPTKQVDDRSLLLTLYRNGMLEAKLTEKDLLDVKDTINNLSERDKRVFDSMKKYYENLANNLDKLIFDTPSQQVAYPFQIINFPMPQGQVIDIQK